MADCSEEDSKPATSRNKAVTKRSKNRSKSVSEQSVASGSGKEDTNEKQIATSSTTDSEQPPPAKRRRIDRFFDPPVPGIRTGLRSQTTKASVVAGTQDTSILPSTSSCSEATSTLNTESSSGAGGTNKAPTEDTSKQSTKFRTTTTTKSAGPSASKSSTTVSEEVPARPQLAGRRKGAQSATTASEAKIRKQTRKGAATSASSSTSSLIQSKTTANTRRGTKVATTGEASSRLKRSTASAAASGASAQSERAASNTGSCASTSALTARRRAAGRGAAAAAAATAAGPSAAGASAATAASTSAAGKGGAEASPADMSTPGNNGNTASGAGAGSSGNSNEEIPPVLQHMAGGLLSEVLRGTAADAGGAAGGAAASDMDMQRLQAMLEARGLPPHMFGTLESNMRNIIQRSMSSSAMTKVTSLIKGMQAKEDEGQQLTAVMEMCQILVMGNEENLAGFPTKQVVPELVSLLHLEHNFDIMMYACRALYYMLEALPRSSLTVVEATPALLDKLKCIQCMDVAEQSLSALDRLSKRHNKNLLQSGAIAACLMYLDFFSIDAQRYALAVAANCCVNITPEEFHYCRGSLPLLSSKLLTADKRSVESVCTCFARLVDNLRSDEKLLKELAAHEMLANTLKLLEVAPPVISSSIFTMVIRMFVVMCSSCPDLAVCLLRQSVSNTLVYLLCGDQGATNHVELVTRTPQELFEIVSLIGELMPALPTTGLFTVDALLKKHPSLALYEEEVTWQWKDDKGTWRAYTPIDSRIIEAAYEASEEEVTLSLSDMGRMYTIDFTMMQQINEETGASRHVFRATNSQMAKKGGATGSAGKPLKPDARAEVLAEQPDLATDFIKSLFGILYEVYSSSAGPAVRHKCLQAILRQIYYASPELLQDVLVNQPVSSHIASMLASQDHKVVVGALQMADILMKKLPDTFTQYFQRQGVTHQIKNLASSNTASTSGEGGAAPTSSTSTDKAKAKVSTSSGASQVSSSTDTLSLEVKIPTAASTAASTSGASAAAASATPAGLSAAGPSKAEGAAAVKSKKGSKRTAPRLVKTRSSTVDSQAGDSSSSSTPSTRGKTSTKKGDNTTTHGSSASASGTAGSSGKLSKASFLASLHPSRWANRALTDKAAAAPPVESRGVSTAALLHSYREKIKTWITTHANEFMTEHFSKLNVTAGKAEGVLLTLSKAAALLSGQDKRASAANKDREALEMIACTVTEDDVSPFEMIHSGVIEKLMMYLTSTPQVASTSTTISDSFLPLEKRLATFMNVFIGSPASPSTPCKQADITEQCRLAHLVSKTMACLHQQEQFQVKVHDLGLGGGSANSNAMKFLSSHQLKCQLQRHPECKTFRQYDGGPVKVDPLAPVHAIENFLIRHGYCKPEGTADPSDIEAISDDEDGNSVDDLDDSMPGMLVEQRLGKHTIELMIGERPLSYNQTVLQAIRNHAAIDDSDSDHALGGTSLWAQTHLIWYRQASESAASVKTPTAVSSKKTKADNAIKSRKSRKSHDFFNDGLISPAVSPLISSLSRSISDRISIQDSCVESVSLIRTLYHINRFWGSLYGMLSYEPVVPDTVFISSKLAAKANRQLQDPLVIMTGNIPLWLPQVAGSCPFLFPFETRQLLFYVNSFDRDRAMMRLQEANTDTMDMDTSGRVAPPRLEKKKKIISRDNLIKQAEHIFEDIGKSKSLLEIQYENEVGTGLGPTLEFYSLVSKELQGTDLDIWHGRSEAVAQQDTDTDTKVYVDSKNGLYPKPLARNAKPAAVSKIKAKFKFIGKLLAKALMDSRILDLPLNPIVYGWLLGQQRTLTSSDLSTFDPSTANSYSQLKCMSDKVKIIRGNGDLSAEDKEKAISEVGIDHLCLDFTLPGYSNIQLRKGGSNESVTADNIDEYLQLLCHWIFWEGIHRQMEALKEGFDCVFSSTHLSDLFTADELEQLFCGNKSSKWDTKELFDCCRADHGYTMDSKTLQNLFEVLSSYDSEQQRKFLSFVTGSPRLPVGGFRSLNPQLTIVRKTFETSENADDFLPSVMTCVNYLKLPDYSSIEIMRFKLDTAATIGQLSFHLS